MQPTDVHSPLLVPVLQNLTRRMRQAIKVRAFICTCVHLCPGVLLVVCVCVHLCPCVLLVVCAWFVGLGVSLPLM